MKKHALHSLITTILIWTAGPLHAEEGVVVLDPAQTRIEFTLHATFHTVHGTFRLNRGTIWFDPATGIAKGEVVADAQSGESGNSGRDSKMLKEILESARYPEITFTPDRVEGSVAETGASSAKVHGIFRIHGSDHEVTLPVQVQMAPGHVTATTHFEIPYVQWGMKNPSTFILRVSDKVDIDIRAVGRLSNAP